MGKYDNFDNAKKIASIQKKLDKLTRKRTPNQFEIEMVQRELDVAKLFEKCQVFKSLSDFAPNDKVLFNDDKRLILFIDKLIRYDDLQSYQIVENMTQQAFTTTKQTGTISRAIVGGAIAGGVGAAVGAMSAGSRSNTTYYESGNGFLFQIFLQDGNSYQYLVQKNGVVSNKIHPKWLELGMKLQMIIDENQTTD